MAEQFEDKCDFMWDIHSSFLSEIKFKAGFFHRSFSVTPWKVTFQPLYKCNKYLEYSFILGYNEPLQPQAEELIAKSLVVHITLNGDSITEQKEVNYHFKSRNEYKYRFRGKMDMKSQMQEHHLIIKVFLVREGLDAYRQVEDPLSALCLSNDMQKLLENSFDSDVSLKASNPAKCFSVHSYILDVSWNNFLEKYKIGKGNQHNVEIDISSGLLFDILIYMYTGRVNRSSPNWMDAAYCAELCDVIHEFRLHELHKYLLKSDRRQQRVTKNPACVKSFVFPLEIVDGRPANNVSPTWLFDSHPEFKLFVKLRVESKAGNWLSFSLRSNTKSNLYAEVNLELVKSRDGAKIEVIPFHAASFTLSPEATEDSGPVLFLGCPETFGDSDRTKTNFSIRFVLNVRSTQIIEELYCESSHAASEWSNFRILGYQMDEVKKRKREPTIEICSKQIGGDPMVYLGYIHKGILKARLPQWWKAINLDEGDAIPSRVSSILAHYSLSPVLDYIYTGLSRMTLRTDADVIRDANNFAKITGFERLEEITDIKHLDAAYQ